MLQHNAHQRVFVGRRLLNGDDALLREHEAHRAGLAQVTAMFGEGMAHFAHRAVAVVGQHVHDERNAAGAVALERDFLVVHAFEFARAALNGALDVVGRHIFGLGRSHGRSQPGIAVRIATTLGGDRDFLQQAGEDLAALGIQRALLVLNCGPFGMAGHEKPQ